MIQQIEKLVSQYKVPEASIEVVKLLYLADQEKETHKQEDLLSVFNNQQVILEQIKSPELMFKGPNGPVLAAIKI